MFFRELFAEIKEFFTVFFLIDNHQISDEEATELYRYIEELKTKDGE